jgi:transcription initiation factor IIE alpha subunit
MSNFVNESGYDMEAKYFHAVEQEKIETIRKMRAAQKKALEKELHWMKCPKCGDDMKEVKLEGIMVDKCQKCAGIYLDQGELELLTGHKESESFFQRMNEVFK